MATFQAPAHSFAAQPANHYGVQELRAGSQAGEAAPSDTQAHCMGTTGSRGSGKGQKRDCRQISVPPLLVLVAIAGLLLPATAVTLDDLGEGLRGALDRQLSRSELEGRTTRCSAYKIANKYCCSQGLVICDNVCFNGTNLLSLGTMACAEGTAAANSGLLQISCAPADRRAFEIAFQLAVDRESDMGPLAPRGADWLAARDAVTWRAGTTALLSIGDPESNIAHFIGRMGQVLLFNNATHPMLLEPVDRFMLRRSRYTLRRQRDWGVEGWFAAMMHNFLFIALRNRFGPFARSPELAAHSQMAAANANGDAPWAFGRIEFEGAMNGATEAAPLCWERAVIVGQLKAISFVGGEPVARAFKEHMLETYKLETPPFTGRKVQLLYLPRAPINGTSSAHRRRLFFPESEAALQGLISELDFEWTSVFLHGLTLREQIRQMQNAEVIVSLHGASLVNACSFPRPNTVVLEILPYNVNHNTFVYMCANAGATYLRHQCLRGTEQGQDHRFRHLAKWQCSIDPACKQYHIQHRNVELTGGDLAALRGLLLLAQRAALAGRAGRAAMRASLRAEYRGLCLPKATLDDRCRQDLMYSPAADPDQVCVITQEC